LFKQEVRESADVTVGRRRGTQTEQWIQESTWTLIDQRKTAKQEREQAKSRTKKEQATAILDRQVKKSCRTDKEEWLNPRRY